MGLLSDLGEILSPQQIAEIQPYLKKLGIKQFLNILKKYKDWQKTIKETIIKWGEQIEGHFLKLNENKELQLCLEPLDSQYEGINFPLVLQYGRWMFEMTPSQPYSSQCNFEEIIKNIRYKYHILQQKSRIALTIPNIPFLGLREFQSEKEFINDITKSLYIDDRHIADHLRFRTLTKNIRIRRGQKVDIQVPIFIDKQTTRQQLSKTEPNPDFIYMDAMAFGMGMACLQCTFSTKNLDHARYVYDQLHILSPLMLAVTAGTPFYKGKIANWDARWKPLEASVDCRNTEERDPKSPLYIPNSRYTSADIYIWNGPFNNSKYNDFQLNLREPIKQFIIEQAKQKNVQIDDFLLNHIANIFKRDILIAHQKFKTMSQDAYTIFEMLNGTNWNSVRLKIPIDDNIGWRVQFRTMEVQLTPDQNAAFSLLIHFLTRVLHLEKKINLYIPMSLVKKNFERAHSINAVLTEKFYFRTNILEPGEPIIKELNINQIFFGNEEFIGIINYVTQIFSQCKNCQKSKDTFRNIVQSVVQHLKNITSGKRMTLATWMRSYVDKHPDYTHNSIIPKKTMDDMLLTLHQISKGTKQDPNFYPIFNL